MRSSYKKLGDYIQQVNIRNIDGKIDLLVGVNLDKKFMPSVANIIGTDLTKYKVIKKGQFGCKFMSVGRDGKLPISLMKEHDEAIISSAYYVFEVKDEKELLSEYLMMWLSRSENDRFLWFISGADVRGSISWDDFCSIKINIPSIEKQKEIVKEYKTITDRIKLNEQLNQKLEETAQAIYKNWFVDFEFPDENGKPYKSSGGEMVFCDELDMEIPAGWKSSSLEKVCKLITKGTTPKNMFQTEFNGSVNYIKAECINNLHGIDEKKLTFIESGTYLKELKRSILEENDLLFSIAGTLGKFSKVYKKLLPANINQAIAIIRIDDTKIIPTFIEGLFLSGWHNEFYKDNIQQAVQENLSLTTIKSLPILIPNQNMLEKTSVFITPSLQLFGTINMENQELIRLKEILLSKMAIIEGKV